MLARCFHGVTLYGKHPHVLSRSDSTKSISYHALCRYLTYGQPPIVMEQILGFGMRLAFANTSPVLHGSPTSELLEHNLPFPFPGITFPKVADALPSTLLIQGFFDPAQIANVYIPRRWGFRPRRVPPGNKSGQQALACSGLRICQRVLITYI